MELEELKKSWQTLDKHLQNRDITTEERVTELIACYKHKAERKLGNLMSLQRISLCIGLFILIAIGTICLLLPSLIDNTDTRTKLQVVLIFLAVTLIAGGGWDWRTYRYMQQTRVDLLPIAAYCRSEPTYRQVASMDTPRSSCHQPLGTALRRYLLLGHGILPFTDHRTSSHHRHLHTVRSCGHLVALPKAHLQTSESN